MMTQTQTQNHGSNASTKPCLKLKHKTMSQTQTQNHGSNSNVGKIHTWFQLKSPLITKTPRLFRNVTQVKIPVEKSFGVFFAVKVKNCVDFSENIYFIATLKGIAHTNSSNLRHFYLNCTLCETS